MVQLHFYRKPRVGKLMKMLIEDTSSWSEGNEWRVSVQWVESLFGKVLEMNSGYGHKTQ